MADQQQSQQTLSPSSDQNTSSHMWDGEEMFNVYIYDYCTKRGYNKTARCLEEEACIPQDNRRPPIDAKQGLLYEWWSVFWVLFTAKTNSRGTDDALLYIQHQQQLSQTRNMLGRNPMPLANGVRPGMPGGPPMPNGIHAVPPSHGHLMPPPIAGNAAQSQSGHAGPQPGPGQQQQPGQPLLGFPGAQQANGARPLQPGQQAVQQPGMPQHGQSQLSGPPPRGTGVSMGFPGPSPTISHAQTPQQQQSQQQQPQGPQPYPPVNTSGTPGGMFPPGSMPGHMQRMPNGAMQSPAFAPATAGGPPAGSSRAPTPAGPNGALTHPSPSMANRTVQTPGGPPSFGVQQQQQPAPPPGAARGPPFESMVNDLAKIDVQTMHDLRVQLGMGNKNINQMTPDEQNRLLSLYKQRQAGPSGGVQGAAGLGRPPKRASMSPEGEQVDPKIETSPNSGQKRIRRTPPDGNGPAPPPGVGAPAQGIPASTSAQMQPLPPGHPMYAAVQSGPAGNVNIGMRPSYPTAPAMSGAPGLVMPPQGQAMHPQMNAQLTQMHPFGAKVGPQFHPGQPSFGPDGAQQPGPRSGPPTFAPGSAPALTAATNASMTARPPGSAGVPPGPTPQGGNMPPGQMGKPGPGMMPPPPSPAATASGKGGQQQQQPGQPSTQQGKMSPPKTDTSPRGGHAGVGQQAGTPGPAQGAGPGPGQGQVGPPPGQQGMGMMGGGMGAPSPGMMNSAGSRPPTANSVNGPPPGTAASTPATPGMRPAQTPTSQGHIQTPQTTPQPQSTPQSQPTPQPGAPGQNGTVSNTNGGTGLGMDDATVIFDSFISQNGFDDFTTMFGRDEEFGNMDWLNDFSAQ